MHSTALTATRASTNIAGMCLLSVVPVQSALAAVQGSRLGAAPAAAVAVVVPPLTAQVATAATPTTSVHCARGSCSSGLPVCGLLAVAAAALAAAVLLPLVTAVTQTAGVPCASGSWSKGGLRCRLLVAAAAAAAEVLLPLMLGNTAATPPASVHCANGSCSSERLRCGVQLQRLWLAVLPSWLSPAQAAAMVSLPAVSTAMQTKLAATAAAVPAAGS